MRKPAMSASAVREMYDRARTNPGSAFPLAEFFRALDPASLDGAVRSDVWSRYLRRCGSVFRPACGRNEFFRRLENVHGLRVVTVRGVRRYRLQGPAEGQEVAA